MGMFDGLISSALSSAFGGGHPDSVASEFMGALSQHGIGGVGDLVSKFEQSGLGAHAASWIGNGQNLAVTPDQIQSVLGQPAIASIAAKFGIDPAQASQMISQHLPDIVSHLTAGGQAPAADQA